MTGLNGLAISMPVAGIIGLLVAGPLPAEPRHLAAAGRHAGAGSLGAVLPFILEFLALRRLTTSAFGTLMSVEPAIALLAGLFVLGQIPGSRPRSASCSW